MKIVSLVAENVKRLSAVEITPEGNLVQITGKNGQGKTSVLDSIWWALAGADHIQVAPIRKGAKSARIRLDLGEIIVTRTFSRKEDGSHTTAITVENADGARFTSPQKMLDALLGELTFDPLAFSRMDAKKQFDALKKFVPDVDFDAIEKAQKADFDKRAELNKFAKQERAGASLIVVPADTPEQLIDESAVAQKMEEAAEHNRALEQRKSRRQLHANQITNYRNEAMEKDSRIAQLRVQITRLEQERDDLIVKADEMQTELNEAEPLPEPVDFAHVRLELERARKVNENVRQLQKKLQHEQRAEQYEKEADELTARRAEREAQKKAAIAKAHLPVDGLGFGDGFIMLNEVPFEQGSDAEQLRASVAIAAAMNPKLRVIRVRDGSLLDDEGMKLLAQIADQHDMQVWVERVDSSGKIGFVLEDGHLKQAATEEAA
jgi:hypothetical protein